MKGCEGSGIYTLCNKCHCEKMAEDALLIDTTAMSIEEVAEKIKNLAEERLVQ